jgi:thymidylate synthase
MNFEQDYLSLLSSALTSGIKRDTRSGIPAYSLLGKTLEHDMSQGFPLLTTRKMPQKSMRVETEFYLRGYTDKKWLQDRGCHFWDYWSNKHSEDENDLGPTYGFQWRHFGAHYNGLKNDESADNYSNKGIDQIAWVLEKLKRYPDNKRLVVSQWNPADIDQQAIPPCPFAFQLLRTHEKLNLIFYQRSGDLCIGVPNDFAQHALLLHLFCKETGYIPGKVIAMFGQVELYENHISEAQTQLTRNPLPLPTVITSQWTDINQWEYSDTTFENYQHHDTIKFEIAFFFCFWGGGGLPPPPHSTGSKPEAKPEAAKCCRENCSFKFIKNEKSIFSCFVSIFFLFN